MYLDGVDSHVGELAYALVLGVLDLNVAARFGIFETVEGVASRKLVNEFHVPLDVARLLARLVNEHGS